MKLFKCTHCGQVLYFENSKCEQCGYVLGFSDETLELTPIVYFENGNYKIYGDNSGKRYRYCKNNEYNVCNWLVPAEDESAFCTACKLNRTIPNISKIEYRQQWTSIERAKHRLVYSLLKMKLPVVSKSADPERGLSFDFIADEKVEGQPKVLTGHSEGLITINIAEADDIEREMARKAMDEVYRTVLGHFRHEVGHYYWDLLIDNTPYLNQCRQLFGDDRKDYGEALKEHYEKGVPPDWRNEFISAYATTHPWEDWAETWAHYLHIIDTLQTAFSFGVSIHPKVADNSSHIDADIKVDPYQIEDFNEIFKLWLPLSFALNSLNRSMGLHDLYPFVIPPKVIDKLSFIHNVCYNSRQNQDPQ
jgi:hypothetical protein